MTSAPGKKAPTVVNLLPDPAILMEARVACGDHRSIKIKEVANNLLHDPVLTMEFLQTANSAMYSGAPVLELDSALSRIGSQKISELLRELGEVKTDLPDEVVELYDVLRFNARRTSIVALIIATAIRANLATHIRTSALMCETGFMMMLHRLGANFADLIKTTPRNKIPYRLEKDHKINVDSARLNFLQSKGIPQRLYAPFDLTLELKNTADVDVRCVVQAALELVDAYDQGKFANYNPDKALPMKSYLRLLMVTPIQMEKLYKTISEYLKRMQATEAPDSAAIFLQSSDEERTLELNQSSSESIKVPNYPAPVIKPSSQDRLQPLCEMCESSLDDETVRKRCAEFLVESGFFGRAAIIGVHPEADSARIVASAGFPESTPEAIPINDPLSPLKLLRLRAKSVNTSAGKPSAPFGVTAFAMGPVGALGSGERVVLYADTNGSKSLTLDMRGVFRLCMNLLSTRGSVSGATLA